MSNVDEFLNFRTETRKQIEIRELQWKVDEQGFSQKDMQLQEQIWELESLQRQNNRDKSAAEESKRLDIHNHNVGIKSRLDQFKRQINSQAAQIKALKEKLHHERVAYLRAVNSYHKKDGLEYVAREQLKAEMPEVEW